MYILLEEMLERRELKQQMRLPCFLGLSVSLLCSSSGRHIELFCKRGASAPGTNSCYGEGVLFSGLLWPLG